MERRRTSKYKKSSIYRKNAKNRFRNDGSNGAEEEMLEELNDYDGKITKRCVNLMGRKCPMRKGEQCYEDCPNLKLLKI